MPPAILNAGRVMPKTLKITLPVEAKTVSTRKQVQAARLAVLRFRFSLSCAPMARNAGIEASGSTVNSTELRETKENWITLSGDGHCKLISEASPLRHPAWAGS